MRKNLKHSLRSFLKVVLTPLGTYRRCLWEQSKSLPRRLVLLSLCQNLFCENNQIIPRSRSIFVVEKMARHNEYLVNHWHVFNRNFCKTCAKILIFFIFQIFPFKISPSLPAAWISYRISVNRVRRRNWCINHFRIVVPSIVI